MEIKEYFKITKRTVIAFLVVTTLSTFVFIKGFNLGISAGEIICKEEKLNEY